MTQIFPTLPLSAEGFETQNFSLWTGVSDSPSVDTSNPYSGNYNLHVSNTSFNDGDIVGPYKYGLGLGTHVNLRAMNLKFAAAGTATGLFLLALDNDVGSCLARAGVIYNNGSWYWGFRYYDATAGIIDEISSVVALPNTNYAVEFEYQHDNNGDNTGYLKLYVNGVLAYSLTGISFVFDRSPNCVIVGLAYCEGGVSGQTDIYADDIVVANCYIGPEITDLTVMGNLIVSGNATVGSTIVSSAPVAGSDDGMILDCWTPSHGDGVGMQNGGMWLKYDNQFDIYRDSGTAITNSLHIDSAGNMEVAGSLHSNVAGHAPVAGSNAGMILDCWTPSHSDGLGIQSGGIWLKYDNQFDIYRDSGTVLTDSLHLDNLGNMTIAGGMKTFSGSTIEHNADYVSISNRVLPTQSQPYKTYTDLGHSNILFKHTGQADATHTFPPSDNGRYANIYQIMLQDPTDNTVYQPMIAMDRGLWVEKDIQAYGALMTSTDPGKPTGGGAVFIGHGLNAVDDPPSIIVSDAGYNKLHIYTSILNHTLGSLRADFVEANLLSSYGNLSIGHLENTHYIGPLYLNEYGVFGYNSSTIRGKQNVRALPDSSWLYDLRPVSFEWKDQERAKLEGTQIGLIAEEVYKVCPNLTWLDKEGEPEGVHYEWLGVPILVELKKLKTEVQDLRSQIQKLTSKEGVSA